MSSALDSEATNNDTLTVILGDEFDDGLRVKLLEALRQLGAITTNPASKVLAGSQELEELDVQVDGELLHIEAETYIGLSISGASELVQQVQKVMSTLK